MPTNYKIQNISPDDVRSIIKEKLDDINIEDLRTWGTPPRDYRLKRIRLPIQSIYYNLENVRTDEECDIFIEENSLPKDYFQISRYADISVQQAHHPIIYAESLKREKEYENKFITLQEKQTEAIYLTKDGIAMNGNTRLSFWRERSIFSDIECLIFLEDYPFQELLEVTNYQDSIDDIDQDYAWYNKVRQVLKRAPKEGYSSEEFKLAAHGAAMKEKTLKEQIAQYYLALEFLKAGYDDYKRFGDLKKIGVGYGQQALKGLREGVTKAEKIKGITGKIINELKRQSWWVINDKASSVDYRDAFRAIQAIWNEKSIKKLISENQEPEELEILDQGDEEEDDDSPDIEKDQDDVFIKKFKEYKLRDEINQAEDESLAFAELIESYAEKIRSAADKHINVKTDPESAKKAQLKLEKAVSDSGKKVGKL